MMPHQIKDFLDEILYFQQQPGLYLERQNWFKVSDYFFLLNHNWPTFVKAYWVDHGVHVSHFNPAAADVHQQQAFAVGLVV